MLHLLLPSTSWCSRFGQRNLPPGLAPGLVPQPPEQMDCRAAAAPAPVAAKVDAEREPGRELPEPQRARHPPASTDPPRTSRGCGDCPAVAVPPIQKTHRRQAVEVELNLTRTVPMLHRDGRHLTLFLDDGVNQVRIEIPEPTQDEPFPYQLVSLFGHNIVNMATEVRRASLVHLSSVAT